MKDTTDIMSEDITGSDKWCKRRETGTNQKFSSNAGLRSINERYLVTNGKQTMLRLINSTMDNEEVMRRKEEVSQVYITYFKETR